MELTTWIGRGARVVLGAWWVLALLAAAAILVFPRTGVPRAFADWSEARTIRNAARAEWPRGIELAGRLDAGNEPIQIVEFSDYECEACRAAADTVAAFLRQYPNVGFAQRHLPIASHPMATPAAAAAICAERQKRLPAFHALLMSTSQWRDGTFWSAEAARTGVPDTTAFRNCLTVPETAQALERDRQLASRLTIRSTPTFVSTRGVVIGVPTMTQLRDMAVLR